MGGLGSLGVFLMNLKGDAGVIVMKQGAISSAAEYYAALLYRDLGLAAPAMRPLDKDELGKVIHQLGDVCFTSPGAGDALQSGGIQRGAVLMDFCPGFTLKHPSVSRMLEDAAVAPKLLEDFGAIIAVDMLTNNFDRTPMVWAHEGNANNVLFTAGTDGVTVRAIDQQTSPIVDQSGEDELIIEYLRKVTGAIVEAARKEASGEYITRVREFILKWTKVDVGDAGANKIQDGICEMAVKIAGYKNFSRLFSNCSTSFTQVGWGEMGLSGVNLPFLERVAETIADAAAEVK